MAKATNPKPSAAPALDQHVAVSPGLSADASLASGLSPDDRAALLADIERIKKIRRPFGAFSQKLALPQRPGYYRHWFNDSPGRLEEALSNGWTHVTGADKKPIKRVVGRGRDNGPLVAFAMELPRVFWEEDMAARNEQAQSRMDDIKSAPFKAQPGASKASDKGKFYSPDESGEVIRTGQKAL